MSKIRCVAFVGQLNELLAFYTFGLNDEKGKDSTTSVSFLAGKKEPTGTDEQFIMYAALDMIDEKIRQALETRKSMAREPTIPNFLGFLGNIGDYQLQGYMTKTKTKIIVGQEVSLLPQPQIQETLKKLHAAYVSWISNPFAAIPTNGTREHSKHSETLLKIATSKSFRDAVARIVDAHNESSR